ncbi:MAG: hypothetical protein KGZ85_02260 [Ignavibacterium sp.]|nr:hypothetical protein [Ignavibacterium sp.]
MIYKLSFTLLFCLSVSLFGQSGKFFDAPFGGGGGYVPAWYVPKVDEINNQLKVLGIPEFSTSGLYSSGGAGFIYIGFVKHLRLGGMGYGGSMSKSVTQNGINRETVYSLGGGALTVEYTLPFIKDVGLSIGAQLGAGSMTVEIFNNPGSQDWSSIWSGLETGSSQSDNKKLTNSYWMISPTLNFEIPVYRFVVFRLGVGYQLSFGDDWTYDNDQTLNNVPSGLNANSFFVQSGLFIGFFSF